MAETPKSRPTASEVARRAGVSRTAVSFVLNNVTDQGISASTRERILQIAQEIGYEPNAAARTLASGSSGTIAIVIPKASHLYVDAFLAQLVASINEECHRRELKLLIESTEDEGRKPGAFVHLVKSRSIDGLIIVNPRMTEYGNLRQVLNAGTPFVVFGEATPDLERFETMGNDTESSAQLATEHLLNLGHKRIAYISFAPHEYYAAKKREQGWRDALELHGITPDPSWTASGDIDAYSGYLATKQLLARNIGFTGLFAGNDTIAFGAIKAFNEAGIRVPHDVAIVGYDDIPLAAFANPPLTTIRSDPIAHGKEAVRLLISQMEGRAQHTGGHHIERVAKLIVRESCGASLRTVPLTR
ncbi:LacI family DNA-binding transcriptional regulator [Burkholderia cepacia]|uniref:LacI family DNA-binding transcriptional regulator n=1 Tax=Burkholderia cepacia TaxID=292 RepID=UPI00249E6EA1|nr:LacI family DNA-binding transcriptional regulator [Burkholderia cepacia]WGY73522.1 LacI family DNA-binding transcriptional regulator [Burkholderia cepacia]